MSLCDASQWGVPEVCAGVGKCIPEPTVATPSPSPLLSASPLPSPSSRCFCPVYVDSAYNCARTYFFTYGNAALAFGSVR